MDFIKRFFGLSTNIHSEDYPHSSFHQNRDQNIREYTPSDGDVQRRGFNVFTDPLQMHQYFEHQMNEMLKNFGFQTDGFFTDFFNNTPFEDGQRTEEGTRENHSGELRDSFLKKGYEKPTQRDIDKIDKDVDGKVTVGDFDSVFRRNNEGSKNNNVFQSMFFGQSQSIKTIKNPDGSIETHSTLRDNEGNEETSVCHKFGDKEYCVTKKTDKHGKEEVIENLINMTETEKDMLVKSKSRIPVP